MINEVRKFSQIIASPTIVVYVINSLRRRKGLENLEKSLNNAVSAQNTPSNFSFKDSLILATSLCNLKSFCEENFEHNRLLL